MIIASMIITARGSYLKEHSLGFQALDMSNTCFTCQYNDYSSTSVATAGFLTESSSI